MIAALTRGLPQAGVPAAVATIRWVELRLAQPSDSEAIRAIYNEAVTGSTATFDLVPRTREEQATWMEDHGGAYPAIVATATADEHAGAPHVLLGFGSLSPYRARPAYATSVENSVYVAAGHRGAGVGRALLGELVRLAGQHGFHTMIARIGGDNDPSIRLHRGCGFELVGTEREIGRKFGRWLDVAILQLML